MHLHLIWGHNCAKDDTALQMLISITSEISKVEICICFYYPSLAAKGNDGAAATCTLRDCSVFASSKARNHVQQCSGGSLLRGKTALSWSHVLLTKSQPVQPPCWTHHSLPSLEMVSAGVLRSVNGLTTLLGKAVVTADDLHMHSQHNQYFVRNDWNRQGQ